MIVFSSALLIYTSCSQGNHVKDYIQSHGYSYPSDVSGVSLWGIRYSGVEEAEMLAPGAREYIQAGLMHIKVFFKQKKFGSHTSDVVAIIVSDPVIYRGESGDVGLMVKVTGYGSGRPDDGIKLPLKWMGKDKDLWKVENFAYFNRRGLDEWAHGGWVY